MYSAPAATCLSLSLACAAFAPSLARGEDDGGLDPIFASAPELRLHETAPLGTAAIVSPTLFGPATAGEAASYYVFGHGRLTEVRLDTADVREHTIPFDRPSRVLYDSGAKLAWLGPDRRIYFALYGKPARIGRFDPATSKMELVGTIGGDSAMRQIWGPGSRNYVVAFPATLSEIDTTTGDVRVFGRLAPDALYVHDEMWIGADNCLYATAGERPARRVRVNLGNGAIEQIAEFPDVERVRPEPIAFADAEEQYDLRLEAVGDQATVTFSHKGGGEKKSATFTASVIPRDLQVIHHGPDGRIYGSGSYQQFAFDPSSGAIDRPPYLLSVYDMLTVGDRLFFCGYPNARVAVLDTTRPLALHDAKHLWHMIGEQFNPRQVLNIYDLPNPHDQTTEGRLAMKRAFGMVRGADGRIYVACTGSRQNWGGALVAFDADAVDGGAPEAATYLREPFRFLGIYAIDAIDDGRQLVLATAVSPDPARPDAEPDAARIFVYDVEAAALVHDAVPLPGVKVLQAIAHAPGTRRVVGIGLPGVEPTPEADNHFSAPGEVFVYDLDERRTVLRRLVPFEIDRDYGRAITAAPDGSLWLSGGGGLLRVDARELTVEPIARIGAPGNLLFVGTTLYLAGSPGLRYADVSPLLRAR